MMNPKISIIFAILTLTACSGQGHNAVNPYFASQAPLLPSFERTFQCENGMTIDTSRPSQTIDLRIKGHSPNTKTLARIHHGTYGNIWHMNTPKMGSTESQTPLFDQAMIWQEYPQTAKFSYTTPNYRIISVRCMR